MGNSPATTAGKNPRENTIYVYVCMCIYIYIYIQYIYIQYIWSNVVDALQLHGGLNYSFALQHHAGQTTLLHILYI